MLHLYFLMAEPPFVIVMGKAGWLDVSFQSSSRSSRAGLQLPRPFTCRLFALDPSIDPSIENQGVYPHPTLLEMPEDNSLGLDRVFHHAVA
jgi:hypothetical protein